MKSFKYILLILSSHIWQLGFTQEAVHNYGTIQIHDSAMIGFHMDLANDGIFDQNLGLVGFYNDLGPLTVSGASIPVFYDAEVAVEGGLFLETTLGITNNNNFIVGDVVTPRSQTDIYLNFLNDAFYNGERALSKVNGYAAITNKDTFTFPVGTDDKLRPLSIASMAINPRSKCAYFNEDPNNPTTFANGFNTDIKASEYLVVSTEEFWQLEGDIPSNITLTWDRASNIGALGQLVTDLKVVGWRKAENQWVNLGSTNVTGEKTIGSITSDIFVPNDYEIITLGGNYDALEKFDMVELDNYFLTPNGDGINDVLIIEGLELSPSNALKIYNRYGVLVYSKTNYVNEFDGKSNRESAINRNAGLESGIYFYIITMNDLRQKHQGYLYISN